MLRKPRAVYFDMDGTIADLYGVEGWLDYLHAEDTTPYDNALPMVDTLMFNDLVMLLQSMGIRVGVISWAAKNSREGYKKAVANAKKAWIKKHVPAVNEVHVVAYGSPKHRHANVKNDVILFDDDMRVRKSWDNEEKGRISVDPSEIISFMADLANLAVREYNNGR